MCVCIIKKNYWKGKWSLLIQNLENVLQNEMHNTRQVDLTLCQIARRETYYPVDFSKNKRKQKSLRNIWKLFDNLKML